MTNMALNKKFLWMFLILLSLFVFIFFTQWYYSNLISTMDLKAEKKKEISDKITKLDNLKKNKDKLEKSWWSESEKIKKYSHKPTESDLIREFYSSVDRVDENWNMKILSLSMSEGVKNELWFMESKIQISARFSNEQVMKDFLYYLTKKSKYKLFISSFNLPKIEEGKEFNLQIPLTLFYVDVK